MYIFSTLAKAAATARTIRQDSKAAKRVTRDILRSGELDPSLLQRFLRYSPDSILLSKAAKASNATTWLGAAIALVVGSLFAGFPGIPAWIRGVTPALQLGTRVHDTFNYLHSIHNSHVDIQHFIYHLPDLGFDLALFSPLYGLAARAFIFFGWRRNLHPFKKAAQNLMDEGQFVMGSPVRLRWKMPANYTGILVGDGDPLADEITRSKPMTETLLFGTQKPKTTDLWVYLNNEASISDLAAAFETADFSKCGRIILLPVQSQHMVFPPNDATDIAPDKLEDLLRNIRVLDKKRMAEGPPGTQPIRMIVVGDRKQSTVIHTYDKVTQLPIEKRTTVITLETICESSGTDLTVIDPTDLLLQRVMELAGGARIAFRGTEDSHQTYEMQFNERLRELNYKVTQPDRIFQMGYNITDDPTVADPHNSAAVILTSSARDALVEKGYPLERILYIPGMVMHEMEARLSQS